MSVFAPCSKPLEKVDLRPRPSKDDALAAVARSPLPAAPISRVSCENGFVNTVVRAYNQHHHLVLRPDDVWLGIMVQFSFYLEKYGEELRSKFVDFQDQKELTVRGSGNLFTANYDSLCNQMAVEIEKNIRDPSIRAWAQPGFSTTTPTDLVVGSITLMASMKKYFSYKMELCCGLPRVTLEGTVDDWRNIEERAKRLLEFDNAEQFMAKWYKLLGPVLAHFTASAAGQADLEWWSRVCSQHGNGSGPRYLSGWITVFCVFNDSGTWIGDQTSTGNVWDASKKHRDAHPKWAPEGWPILNFNDIPSGSCQVDVLIDDNGTKYNCKLIAGHRAMCVPEQYTVRPSLEWLLVLKKDLPQAPSSDF